MFGSDIQGSNIFSTLPSIQVKKNFRKKEPHNLNNRYRVFDTIKSLNERFSHIFESFNRDGQNCDLFSSTKKMPSLSISLVCKEDMIIQRNVKEDWNNAKSGSGHFLHNYEGVKNVQKYGFQTLRNQRFSNGSFHEEAISTLSISSPNYPSIEQNDTHETGGEKLYGNIPNIYTVGKNISSQWSSSPSLTSDGCNKAISSQLEGIYTPTDMPLCSDQEDENGPDDKTTPNKVGDKFQCFNFEAPKVPVTVQNMSFEYMTKSEDSVSTVGLDVEHSLPVDVKPNSQAVENLQQKMRSKGNLGDEDILNEGLVELEKSFSRRIRECNLNSQSNPQKPLAFHERTLLFGNVPPVAIPLELTSNEQCLKWHDGQLVSCKRDPRLEKAREKKHRRCSLIKLSYGRHQNKGGDKLTMNNSVAPSNTSSLSSTIISSDGEGGTAKNLSCESSSTTSMKAGKTATNLKLYPKSNYSSFTEGSDCAPHKLNYHKDNENQLNLNIACQTHDSEATSSLCDKETIPGLDLIMNVVDLHYKKDSDIAQLRDIVNKQKTSESHPKTNVDTQSSLSQMKSNLDSRKMKEYLNLLPQLTTTKTVDPKKLQKVLVSTSANVLQNSDLESYHTAKKHLPTVNEVAEVSKDKANSVSLPININNREQSKPGFSSFLGKDNTRSMIACCQTNEVFKNLFELLTEAGKIQDTQQKDRKLTEALELVVYALKTHNCHFV